MNRSPGRASVALAAFLLFVGAPVLPATITVTGVNGQSGADGWSGDPPQPGQDGTAAGPAVATAAVAGDATNTATATAGHGGSGGRGGDALPADPDTSPPLDGAAGGHGARGGDALATASSTVASGEASATATARAGSGANGGSGGYGWPPPDDWIDREGIHGNGGRGGDATAAAEATAPGAVTVTAIARGGQGGGADFEGLVPGDGGNAVLGVVHGESTGGGEVRVDGRAYGGSGYLLGHPGQEYASQYGNGASVTVVDAVSGRTSGALHLQQEAHGGDGRVAGDATSRLSEAGSFGSLGIWNIAKGGWGYHAGSATAAATGVNHTGTAHVQVDAQGGQGYFSDVADGGDADALAVAAGRGTDPWGAGGAFAKSVAAAGWAAGPVDAPAGRGGDAASRAEATATGAGLAYAEAGALGGNGQYRGGSGVASALGVVESAIGGEAQAEAWASAGRDASGARGFAAADATARARLPIGSAMAWSEAVGGEGSATATTDVAGGGLARSRVEASAPVLGTGDLGGRGRARARTSIGTAFWPGLWRPAWVALDVAALPLVDDRLANQTAGHAEVQAALYGGEPVDVLLIGAFAGAYPEGGAGTGYFRGSVDMSFDTATLAASGAALQVGLFAPVVGGAGFDELQFRIYREDELVLDETFLTLTEALALFDDEVLDFGPWAGVTTGDLDLRFEMDLWLSDPADAFGFNFLAMSQVPAPPAAWLFGSGVAVAWRYRARRCR